jgi:hypothetical protein
MFGFVPHRHDLVLHRIATLPVAVMHCNNLHTRATVFENATLVGYEALVQGAAHGKVAATTQMPFSARRGTANR